MEVFLLKIIWADTLSLVGVCFGIVLTILFLFVGVLKIFELVKTKGNKSNNVEIKKTEKPKNNTDNNEVEVSDAEYVAIATAIHLYYDVKHDEESLKLTIKNDFKNSYSPWNIIK